MNTIIKSVFAFLPMAVLISLSIFCKDRFVEERSVNQPIYMGYDEFRNAVEQVEPKQLDNVGKTYFYNNLAFVVENIKGFHIIDNSNPKNPNNLYFVNVPGNVDLVVHKGMVYADSYTDLVVIDIVDLENIREVNRIVEAFPYILPPFNQRFSTEDVDPQKGIVVGWRIADTQNEEELGELAFPVIPEHESIVNNTLKSIVLGNGALQKIDNDFWEMPRVAVYMDHLFTYADGKLKMYELKDPKQPKEVGFTFVNHHENESFQRSAGQLVFDTYSGKLVYYDDNLLQLLDVVNLN